MSTLRRSLDIAGVFTAVILGAGFASGQELLSFFVMFGGNGYLGLLVAGLVFALVGWAVLDLRIMLGANSYIDLTEHIMGRNLALIMDVIVACFLFVLFSTMLAASGAALYEAFGLTHTAGAAVAGGLCFLLFAGGLDRIVKLSRILAPIMIAGGVFVGLFSFLKTEPVFLHLNALRENNWLVSAVVYASYNIITAVTVLASMDADRKSAFLGPTLGAIAITFLGICMSLPLSIRVVDAELPLLRIAVSHGSFIKIVYLIVLISAIITTAAANGFAFADWLGRRFNAPPVPVRAGVCIFGLFAARLGFSNFVAGIYPLFGYAGLFQIALILFTHWRIRLFTPENRVHKSY